VKKDLSTKEGFTDYKKMYDKWKLPRTDKLSMLATFMLASNDRYRTEFLAIRLHHVGNGKLVMSWENMCLYRIVSNGNDNPLFSQDIIGAMRPNIVQLKASIPPHLQNFRQGIILFQIVDTIGKQEVPWFTIYPIGMGAPENFIAQCVAYASNEQHIISYIENINNTSKNYVPSNNDFVPFTLR